MKMIINGSRRSAPVTFDVMNPHTGTVVDTVPSADKKQIQESLSSARQYDHGLAPWERFEILNQTADRLADQREDFEQLITRESGKPLQYSRHEVNRALKTLRWCAEEAKRMNGRNIPVNALSGLPDKRGITHREPLGVVAAFTPFNYPLNLVIHKIGPSIAANNATLLKPSEKTPLTALKLHELLRESGLQDRMLQTITGEPERIIEIIREEPSVRCFTYTGSVEVGQEISNKIGMKQLCMELGGNCPLLVFPDADLDEVVPEAVQGAFGNNGQRCTSIKRLLVHEDLLDSFVPQFVEQTEELKVGDPSASKTDLGPLINDAAADRVHRQIQDALEEGAELLSGGGREDNILEPTILQNVPDRHPLIQQETFGPVAPIIPFQSDDEAVDIANATRYGLQAGVRTNNLKRAKTLARNLDHGAVMINENPGFRAEHLPFGGVKDSGFGREGVRYAIEELTELKTIVF